MFDLIVSFILSDDTTVEKIIEYMQTYRSNIELSDYSLYNCDAQLVPFDNPTLKLATIKNHVIYLIKNQSEHKVLEIRLVDVKKRFVVSVVSSAYAVVCIMIRS